MADSKISALTAAASAALADLFAIVQGGTTKYATGTMVKSMMGPTAPTIPSVGAEFTGTGAPTATLPGTHTTNDILVLCQQSSNEAITIPANYNRAGPQNGLGTAVAAGANRGSVSWKRDGGSESAPTITDSGDHTYGVMLAVRGCPTTGDPFHFGGSNFKSTTSTSGSGPACTTYVDNCLVMDIFFTSVDNASGQLSGAAVNADLSSLSTQFNDGTTDGTGGGIVIVTGIKATAGPVRATTTTWSNTSVDLCIRLVFLPADYIGYQPASRGPEIQIFAGSAQDTDDVWTKPTGAKRVHVQLIGGGASGSSGHTTSTPAGGGGGGGGHYTERWFNADDLGATVNVHAGKGGAATTAAVDQAGNAGANSWFNTSTFLVGVAGRAPTAAASADGGDGGGGGGTTSPAVATLQTIAAGELGTAGATGTTTGVAGSPGEHGGGGGSSGTTAANATLAGGLSKYGGGGGDGGSNTGTHGGGGAGGGAAAPSATAGTNGTDSTMVPCGGSGGTGGSAATPVGGVGGFPGGGGGGGGGNNAGTQGNRGGHGCVVVTTYF